MRQDFSRDNYSSYEAGPFSFYVLYSIEISGQLTLSWSSFPDFLSVFTDVNLLRWSARWSVAFLFLSYLSIALPRSFVLVHITHATRARINAHTHSTHARTYARTHTHIHDRFVRCKGHNVTTAYSCVYFFQVEFVLILKISCESWVHKNLRNIVIFTLMSTQQNVVLISMISWDGKRWQYPSGLVLPGNRDTGYFESIHWPWMWPSQERIQRVSMIWWQTVTHIIFILLNTGLIFCVYFELLFTVYIYNCSYLELYNFLRTDITVSWHSRLSHCMGTGMLVK